MIFINPLVVGIDPGTTIGIAVFDLDGNLLTTHSCKNFSLADVSSLISNHGRPVIIAGDVPAPRYVERLARVFSAKLITPNRRLSKKQKNQMIRGFFSRFRRSGMPKKGISNHEKDAIVSALYAFKRISPLLSKINKKLSRIKMRKQRVREIGYLVKTNVLLRGESVTTSIQRFA